MKKYVSLILLLGLSLLFISSSADSCTIFKVSNSEKTFVGNNEDWLNLDGNDSMVCFLPATKDKYGRVFFGWKSGSEGGMNDQGLFFDWVAHTPQVLAPIDLKKKTYTGETLLEKCSNIHEALEIIKNSNFTNLGFAEMMLVDKSGDSAVVTWDWGHNELSITRSNNDYQIIGYDITLIQPLLEQKEDKVNIGKFRSMLEASKQGELTVYSNIYDLKNKEVYVYFNHDFQKVVKFNLNHELKKGSHFYHLYSLFPDADRKLKLSNYLSKEFTLPEWIILFIFSSAFGSMMIIGFIQFIKSIRKLSKGNGPRVNILAYTIAGLNGLVCFAALYLIVRYAGFISNYGFRICGVIQGFIPIMIVAFTLMQLIFTILLWKNKSCSFIGRLFYSISTLMVSFFLIGLYLWGLIKI